MPLSGGQTFTGYRIVRLLGSGGMGEVYLTEHPRLPRCDALKVLPADISSDPDYRARFNREADLASKLWHPHIVSVHDRGEYDDQLWISMDFVDGLDAARLLATRAARPAPPPWTPWQPGLQLTLWFVACLDAIEAGLITPDEIPPESGLNGDVIAALKAVETWDLSDEWEWTNTPVTKRGDYPILLAHQALAKQCRAVEGQEDPLPGRA